MTQRELYCRQCDARFNVAAEAEDCPRCGQTLVAWHNQATIELSADRLAAVQAEEEAADELLGRHLGNYYIEQFLGQGGMARVYRAKHLTLERPCAIKVLRPSLAREPDAAKSLLAEARNSAALVHPHVVTLYTIGQADQHAYLELEYVDGESLARRLDAHGPLETTTATRFMMQIGFALAAAHELGIIHRDLKPSNVMVTRDGTAKLSDFGLAKRLRSKTGGDAGPVLAGTPHYMAPELFLGHPADTRSDVYAMGVMFFSLLTGRLPIASESLVELIALHAQRRDLPMEDLLPMADDAVRWVIQRCLAHSPEERYSCGRQLADELRALYGSHRSLENLLRESLGGTGVTLSGSEDRFVVRVPLPEGRFQEVFVEICRRSSVAEQVVKIYSVCGPVDESYFRQALELNAETPHGSIAIQTVNNQPRFVMSNAYPRATCDEEEVRQSVLMIAQRADEVERLLTGGDAF